MRYNSAGSTGIRLSAIGFGCGGNAGLMVRGSARQQRTAIARALELGVNYFDTAPDYGNGLAERNLGLRLKELAAKPYVTTKVEVRRRNLRDVAGEVIRSVEESLSRLDLDCVDFVQIHNAPAETHETRDDQSYERLSLDRFFGPSGALEGLSRLRQQGKARFAGVVVRGDDAHLACRLLETGQLQLINASYHLLNPSAGLAPVPGLAFRPDWGNVIGLAAERGAGVAIYSPLAGGVLTEASLQSASPHRLSRQLPAREERLRTSARANSFRFLSQAGGHHLTLSANAYRFILAHPHVTTVIGGFSDARQVEEAVASEALAALNAGEMASLEAAWRGLAYPVEEL